MGWHSSVASGCPPLGRWRTPPSDSGTVRIEARRESRPPLMRHGASYFFFVIFERADDSAGGRGTFSGGIDLPR
jgi:hypothetical protein